MGQTVYVLGAGVNKAINTRSTGNVFKIPDDMDWNLAASLPVTSLTPYHALNESSLKLNEYLLVFGASGNTGMIAVQLGRNRTCMKYCRRWKKLR